MRVEVDSDREYSGSDHDAEGDGYDANASDEEFFGHVAAPIASRHPKGTALTKNGRPRAAYGSRTAGGLQRNVRSPFQALPTAHRNCQLDRVTDALAQFCCHENHLLNLTPQQLVRVREVWAAQGSREGQKNWMVDHLRDSVRVHREADGAVQKTLEYRLPLPESGNPVVCERGFLIAFGMGQHGFSERMLSQARAKVLHDTPLSVRQQPARNNPQQTRCLVWLTRYVENLDRVGEDADGTIYHMHQYLLWSSLYEAARRDFVEEAGGDRDIPTADVFNKIRRKRFRHLHRPNKGTYGRCTMCGTLWRKSEEAYYRDDPEVSVSNG